MFKTLKIWDREHFPPGSILKVSGVSDLSKHAFHGYYTLVEIDEDIMVVQATDGHFYRLYVGEVEGKGIAIKVFVQGSIEPNEGERSWLKQNKRWS